jgi:hypothetical protein
MRQLDPHARRGMASEGPRVTARPFQVLALKSLIVYPLAVRSFNFLYMAAAR